MHYALVTFYTHIQQLTTAYCILIFNDKMVEVHAIFLLVSFIVYVTVNLLSLKLGLWTLTSKWSFLSSVVMIGIVKFSPFGE